MMVKVAGSKAKLIVKSYGHGEHEPGIHDGDSVVGHEIFEFEKILTVRTGTEPAVNAISGDHCGGQSYPHNVKIGTLMYDMGPQLKGMHRRLVCFKHYPNIPTLESLYELYSKPYYMVTITDNYDGGVLFESKQFE